MKERLRIAFVRRGYSPTGGAETYLKRLAHGVIEAGHDSQLIATNKWQTINGRLDRSSACAQNQSLDLPMSWNKSGRSSTAILCSALSGSGPATFIAPATASTAHGWRAEENSSFL